MQQERTSSHAVTKYFLKRLEGAASEKLLVVCLDMICELFSHIEEDLKAKAAEVEARPPAAAPQDPVEARLDSQWAPLANLMDALRGAAMTHRFKARMKANQWDYVRALSIIKISQQIRPILFYAAMRHEEYIKLKSISAGNLGRWVGKESLAVSLAPPVVTKAQLRQVADLIVPILELKVKLIVEDLKKNPMFVDLKRKAGELDVPEIQEAADAIVKAAEASIRRGAEATRIRIVELIINSIGTDHEAEDRPRHLTTISEDSKEAEGDTNSSKAVTQKAADDPLQQAAEVAWKTFDSLPQPLDVTESYVRTKVDVALSGAYAEVEKVIGLLCSQFESVLETIIDSE